METRLKDLYESSAGSPTSLERTISSDSSLGSPRNGFSPLPNASPERTWYDQTEWYRELVILFSNELSAAEKIQNDPREESKLATEHLHAKQGTYWRQIKFLNRQLDSLTPDISLGELESNPSKIVTQVLNYFVNLARMHDDKAHSIKDLTASLRLAESQNAKLKMQNSQQQLVDSRVSLDSSAELTRSVLDENERLIKKEKNATQALKDLEKLFKTVQAAHLQDQKRIALLEKEKSEQEGMMSELFSQFPAHLESEEKSEKKEDPKIIELRTTLEAKEKECKETAERETVLKRKAQELEEQKAELVTQLQQKTFAETQAQQKLQQQIVATQEAQQKLATQTSVNSTLLIQVKMQTAQKQREEELLEFNSASTNWSEVGAAALLVGGAIDLMTVLAVTGAISLTVSTLGFGLLIALGTTLIALGLLCLYQARKKTNAAAALEAKPLAKHANPIGEPNPLPVSSAPTSIPGNSNVREFKREGSHSVMFSAHAAPLPEGINLSDLSPGETEQPGETATFKKTA